MGPCSTILFEYEEKKVLARAICEEYISQMGSDLAAMAARGMHEPLDRDTVTQPVSLERATDV